MGYEYQGKIFANTCVELWNDRRYILRQVETIDILDRSIQQRRITFDLDRCALEALGGPPRVCSAEVSGLTKASRQQIAEGIRTSMRMPLIELKKSIFFDVDIKNSQGNSMHLSRRHSNMDFSAHLIVGTCLSAPNMDSSKQEELYSKSYSFLSDEGSQRNIINSAAKAGLTPYSEQGIEFRKLLGSLRTRYIQCIELDDAISNVEIIKVKIANTLWRTPAGKQGLQIRFPLSDSYH